MNFKTAASLLLLSSNLVVAEQVVDENCVPIEQLGTPSLERFDFSISMEVDDACGYEVKIVFKHDEALPLPTNPPAQCDPTIVPPEFADDGLPYFGFRWFYEAVPADVQEVTGIDHISIDWNACGHPPVEKFGAPHYDLHIYTESPEFRTCMTCVTPPGAPICDPTPGAQTTPNGEAFFNVAVASPDALERAFDPLSQPANMPADFAVAMDAFVPTMGGHGWNPEHEPPSFLEWVNPVWIMGPYDGGIIDYEPMIPFAFMSGDEDKEFMESLSYEGQTIMELPSSYKVEYNATTKEVCITLTGLGSCPVEEEPIVVEEDSDMSESGSVSTLLTLAFSATSIVTSLLF
jgi:hypothetical protein